MPANEDPLRLIIESARDQRVASTNIIVTTLSSRNDILKDYAITGIGVLGLSLTILTVKSSFIKTPVLFALSLAIVLISIVITFWIRIKHNDYLLSALGAIEEKYAKTVGPARSLFNDPASPIHQRDLDQAIQLSANMNSSKSVELSYRYVGIGLLIGVLGVVSAILLKITF